MGVGKGIKAPPWILKCLAKKGCFVSFEWEKTKLKFTTFGPPLENFWENPLVPPLEKIFPTPMVAFITTRRHACV